MARRSVKLAPFMPARELARALGEGSLNNLLRRASWHKGQPKTPDAGKYVLRVGADDAAARVGGVAAQYVLPPGTYYAAGKGQCIVPLGVSLQLAESQHCSIQVVDPEPVPPPRPVPPGETGTGVVAVLAHVDHGKTTLLDALLGTDIAPREAGLITQCVRPSILQLPESQPTCESGADGRVGPGRLQTLAFVDTPGHKIFSGMRSVAADGADLALVLIAVDAGIQPQTREVLRRCASLQQPVMLALTKADTAGATRAEASRSPRVRLLRQQLRRMWMSELRRHGATPRRARHLATRAILPLICAPRRWGLESLVAALRHELRRIRLIAPSESARRGSGGDVDGGGARWWYGRSVPSANSDRIAQPDSAGGGARAEVELSPAPTDEAVAVVLECARLDGLGTTILAIIRRGILHKVRGGGLNQDGYSHALRSGNTRLRALVLRRRALTVPMSPLCTLELPSFGLDESRRAPIMSPDEP